MVCALIGASSFHALADSTFGFGPSDDYVTESIDFSRPAMRQGMSQGPWTYLSAFSDTEPLSPESEYRGPKFYGGYTLTSSDVKGSILAGTVLSKWPNIGNIDALRIYAALGSGWDSSVLSFAAVYVFKTVDSEANAQDGKIFLKSLSVRYRASGADGAFLPTGRWMVKIDGVYYLSDAKINSAYNTISTVTLSEAGLHSVKWTVYNPASSLFFKEGKFSTLDLSRVTAAGIHFEQTSYQGTSDTSAALLAISEFSASGSSAK